MSSLNASEDLIAELIPIIMERLHQFKPVELCQVLRAFTNSDLMTPEMVKAFEIEFGGRYESMNPDDISQFYYCFTKLGFVGDGLFYKYL